MNLNSVLTFGNLRNWNSAATLALTIIAVILLVGVIFWLIVKIAKLSTLPNAEKPQVVVVEGEAEDDTTVIVKRKKKKKQKVIIVEEQQPEEELSFMEIQPTPVVVQEQPQYTYVQQAPAPKLQAAAAPVVAPFEEGEDFEDEEDVVEESVEGGIVRYNRSFMAKYIQASNETKDYYVHLKNKLLSYKRVRSRVSWKRESFNFGRNAVARIVFRGKTLCLCLPLDPAQFNESKYHVEDVSDVTLYSDTPCLYRIRNDRRLEYAYELIEMVAQQVGTFIDPSSHDEDYYLTYEGIVQLIDKGLVKRIIRRNDSTFIDNN